MSLNRDCTVLSFLTFFLRLVFEYRISGFLRKLTFLKLKNRETNQRRKNIQRKNYFSEGLDVRKSLKD